MALNLELINTTVNDTNAESLTVIALNNSVAFTSITKDNFTLYVEGSTTGLLKDNYNVSLEGNNFKITFLNDAPKATDYIIVQTTGFLNVGGDTPFNLTSNRLFVDFTETFTDGSATFNQLSFPESGEYSIVLNSLNNMTLNKESTQFQVVNAIDSSKVTIAVKVNPNRSVFVNEPVPVVVTVNDKAGNPISGLKAPIALSLNKN